MGFFCFFICPKGTLHLYRLLVLGICLSWGLCTVKSQDQYRKVKLSWKQKNGLPQLHKLRLYETHTGELSFLSRFPSSSEKKIWRIQTEPGGQIEWLQEEKLPSIKAYLGQNRLEATTLQDSGLLHWVFTIPGDTFQLSPYSLPSSEIDSFAFSLHRIYPLPPAGPASEARNLAVPLLHIKGIRETPRSLTLLYLEPDTQLSNLVQIAAILVALQSSFSP